MKDMVELKATIERTFETPSELRDETVLAFVSGGSYVDGTQHSEYTGRAYDCEGDLLPFFISWVKTDHYEVTTAYLGGQIILLESEGGAITHPYKEDA